MNQIQLINERYNSYMHGNRARHPWFRWSFETEIPHEREEIGTEFEKEVYRILAAQNTISTPCETMASVLIPKGNDKYTEADIIHISEYGIFVIETKNWNAKVGGTLLDKEIPVYFENTQQPEMKYNPFIQNQGHIYALANLLNEKMPREVEDITIYNIVITSDKTDLSNMFNSEGKTPEITTLWMNYTAINNFGFVRACKEACGLTLNKLNNVDIVLIEHIYQVLNESCPKDPETRQKHLMQATNRGKEI